MPNEPDNLTPEAPSPEDWRDRLVDRALAESVGGESPPDLSAQILAAANTNTEAEVCTSNGDLTMATAPAPASFGLRGWVLAASLIINCGLLAMLFASRGDQQPVLVLENTGSMDAVTTVDVQDESESVDVPQVELDDLMLGTEVQQSEASVSEYPEFTSDLEIPFRQDSFSQSVASDNGSGSRMPSAGESAGDGLTEGYLAERDESLSKESFLAREEKHPPREPLIRTYGGSPARPPAPSESNSDYGLATDGPTTHLYALEGKAITGKSLNGSAHGDYGRNLGLQGLINSNDSNKLNRRHFRGFDNGATPYYRIAGGYDFYSYGGRGQQTWGFRSYNGRQWPRGEWQGSPDGEGIGPGASGDQYERIHENPFIAAIGGEAISTFSIDVDTASYANVRQMLTSGHRPPADAVRIEELVNYFKYDYQAPVADEQRHKDPFGPKTDEPAAPFAAHVETAECPWRPEHRLVRIGIKGREVKAEKRPLSNLVFLVDVSGSMNNPDKLPLVKHGLKQLAQQLGENDRVAIVVYASSEGLVLPSTPGTEQETILAALDSLQSGGSTAGGAGITLAYKIAEDNFIKGGTNRVILCTDGDFNVGTTSTAELERLVEKKAKDTKVFLSCIGVGRGNLNDAMMEKITGIGNGNYFYADDEREAQRVFVRGMTGMLVTIAKDVKIQVEFNPAKVAGYRLLGYENRMLKTQDFNDDKKDAGEIGAGHTVTCLYEIVPAGEPVEAADIDELKYQRPASLTEAAEAGDLLTLKMRYKQPDEDTSSKLEWPIADSGNNFGQATRDFQFAASVASFGMLVRGSQYAGESNYDAVIEIAESTLGEDPEGERAEFVELVRAAKKLAPVVKEAEAEKPDSEEASGENAESETVEE